MVYECHAIFQDSFEIAFCHEFRPSFNKNQKHAYITNLRLIQTITIPVSGGRVQAFNVCFVFSMADLWLKEPVSDNTGMSIDQTPLNKFFMLSRIALSSRIQFATSN